MRDLIKILLLIVLANSLIVILPTATSGSFSSKLKECLENQKILNGIDLPKNNQENNKKVCPNGGQYLFREDLKAYACLRDGPITILKANVIVCENPFLSLYDFAFLLSFQSIPLIILLFRIRKKNESFEVATFPIAFSFFGLMNVAALKNYSIVYGLDIFVFENYSQSLTFSIFLVSALFSFIKIKDFELKILISFYSIILSIFGFSFYYVSTGGT